MGGLIPIGGGADGEIKSCLNAAFNDRNIKTVKGVVANENLFDEHHHLHRVAYRLGTYPVGSYAGDNAQGKWFFFLKNVLSDSTKESIKAVLIYALANSGTRTSPVKRVVFDAVQSTEHPVKPHYVSPNNPVSNADIAHLVDTTGTLKVLLICPAPLSDDAIAIPNKQGDLDRNDQGNIIEKPPIKIFTPPDLSPPKLSKRTPAK